ncbi:hypothetical protein CVT26_004372 [Gymnopilus dilepis]|uniref:CBM21 domain-containing protein n=1 Tax=Gymnopilus dilepis TaxID=231916 RepID=A0A409WU02_9AGAR|nr:hypothetical protein CVT26_004372 [Gymnopilus dilepis]
MHLTNKPTLPDPSSLDANTNVLLEDMALSPEGTTIQGRVLVRNLAYAKHVSVRFTFDRWQTTSEVVGKYVESLSSPEGQDSNKAGWDRFGFTIRVGDLLASIEGKRLEVAVRYVVQGREFWDNCGGGNYVAWFEFERVKRVSGTSSTAVGNGKEEPVQQGSPTKKTTTCLALNSEDEADMKDLKTKLEKEAELKDVDFRSPTSFAARYDFSESFRSAAAWNPDRAFSPVASGTGGKGALHSTGKGALHSRTQSFPLSSSSSKSSNGHGNGWPQQKAPSSPYAYALRREGLPPPSLSASSRPMEIPIVSPPSQNKGVPLLGSPRDLDEGSYAHNANALRSPLGLELGEVPFPVQQVEQPAPAQVHARSGGGRNHQRGYFDISFPSSSSFGSSGSVCSSGGAPSTLRRTPPGTPRSPGEDMYLGSPHRYNSFPSMGSESESVNASGGSERSERSSSFSSFTSAALSSSFLRDVTPTPRQGRPAHGRHHSAAAPVLRQEEVTSVPMNSKSNASNASSSSTESEESELSTPSMSRESSPDVSPAGLFVGLSLGDEEGLAGAGGFGVAGGDMSMMSPDTHYRQFLNK